MKNCPNCGNIIEENSKFCGACGNPINNENVVLNQNTSVSQENVSNQVNNESIQPVTEPINNSVNQMNNENINPINSGMNQLNNENIQSVTEPINNGVNQMNNYQQMPSNKNNKNTAFIIFIVIASLVIVGLIAFIIINILPTDKGNSDKKSDNEVTDKSNSSKEDVSTTKTSSADTINFSGYKFEKNSNHKYGVKNEVLYIADKNEKQFMTTIEPIKKIALSDVKISINEIEENIISQGFSVSGHDIKSYGGKDFVILYMSIVQQGVTVNLIDYITDVDAEHVAIGSLMVNDGYTYTQALTELSKFIGSAQEDSSSSDSEEEATFSTKIPISEINN